MSKMTGDFERRLDHELHEMLIWEEKIAFEKALALLGQDAIKPGDFSDLYSRTMIEQDQRMVEGLKSRWETNLDKQISTILEAIMYERIELDNWLGENASTIKTSDYDDYINGVDLVVEFSLDETGDSPSRLALAVDVTFGTTSSRIKFEKIKEQIDSGQLSSIKYFKSENQGFRGEINSVPRVVIGVERDKVAELARLWVAGKKSELADNPVKDIIINEIKTQLDAFYQYALSVGQDNAAIAYKRTTLALEKIFERPDLSREEIPADGVWQQIEAGSKRFTFDEK